MKEKHFSKLVIILFVFTILKSVDVESAQNSTARWSFGSYFFHNNHSLEFQISISAPTEPGTYPVVFFLTGFDGLCPTDFYIEFLTDLITESKTIVVGFDKLSPIKLPDKEESVFEISLNWAIENLSEFFKDDKTPPSIKDKVFPDIGPNGYALMAHSSAGHPVCSYLYKHCGDIKKVILMDPVDGYDPFGIVKSYCTNPPNQLPFKIPTLIISTGLDPVPVFSISSACAPTNISNGRFYAALPGPTFYLNFTRYGHADVLDEWVRKNFAAYVCTACDHKYKDCDFLTYRANLAYAIKYFINAVDEKNPAYFNALLDPNKSGLFNSTIDISSKFKSNGFDILKTGPFCLHD